MESELIGFQELVILCTVITCVLLSYAYLYAYKTYQWEKSSDCEYLKYKKFFFSYKTVFSRNFADSVKPFLMWSFGCKKTLRYAEDILLNYGYQTIAARKLAVAFISPINRRSISSFKNRINPLFHAIQGHDNSKFWEREEILGKRSLNLKAEINSHVWYGETPKRKMDSNEDEFIVPSQEDSELDRVVAEYFKLSIKENTSVEEDKRLNELLELAIVDEELDEKIHQVDVLIYNLQKLDFFPLEREKASYDIEHFLKEILERKQNGNHQLEPEEFDNIARKLTFTPEIVQRYVHFKKDGSYRKVVFSSDDVCVYIISWLPGQKTLLHTHEFSFCSTYIYQGTITIEEFISKDDTEQKQIQEYKKGEWFFSPSQRKHRLSNNSSENLVTIHYRYFKKDPKECEQLMPSCYKRDRKQEINDICLA